MSNKNATTFGIILATILLGFLSCGNSQMMSNQFSSNYQSEDIGYETHVQPIIKNFCLTCHGKPDPIAGVNLTTYEHVRELTENGPLLERINDEKYPMPEGGLMPERERAIIQQWADNNYARAGSVTAQNNEYEGYEYIPAPVNVVDIDEEGGFEFFQKMSGHFVGEMHLMGQDIPWFAFDFRPIGSAHVLGLFEGGSMGNLFTSFFIANYQGKKTIVVRNGGILSGIYRTSYFVLDKVSYRRGQAYYRFVDAYAGKDIMYIEVIFEGDNKINFKSYTSRFGTYPEPKLHMDFKGENMHPDYAAAAIKQFNYPQNEIQFDFKDGLPAPDWGDEYPIVTSASYMWQDLNSDLITLGKQAGDPIRIDQIPYLSQVNLKFNRNDLSEGKRISFYLSEKPLTNKRGKLNIEWGYVSLSDFNTVVLFPELKEDATEFNLTYLHPGKYYLTAIVDVNGDMAPSEGDYTSASQVINVEPNTKTTINVNPINTKN